MVQHHYNSGTAAKGILIRMYRHSHLMFTHCPRLQVLPAASSCPSVISGPVSGPASCSPWWVVVWMKVWNMLGVWMKVWTVSGPASCSPWWMVWMRVWMMMGVDVV